jgi:hypothetical protein
MSANPIHLDTNLAWAKGGYTVQVHLGSARAPANLVLDTGSSTRAVSPGAYDAQQDASRSATPWAQDIQYGSGAWAGPVLRSCLAVGEGRHARRIDDALFALIETPGQPFRQADGIFGLAYRELDPAHDISGLLQQRGVQPPVSWPWTLDADAGALRGEILQQPRVDITPAFTALEEEGVVRDQFALLVQRAVVHVASDGLSDHALAADPLNRGTLVLGGGVEAQSLYHGGFQDIRVVHDLYYNANLVGLRIGDGPLVPAPPLAPADVHSHGSNALLDTGSSFLVLEASLYAAAMSAFAAHDARLPALVDRFGAAFKSGQGLPNHAIDHRDWPDLHLHFESPTGGDTAVRIVASHYWPHNALNAGQALFLLMPGLAHFPRQSILGLPLFAGRYAVFDRRAAGQGTVRLAQGRAT